MSVFINFRRAQKLALFQFEKKSACLKKKLFVLPWYMMWLSPGIPGCSGFATIFPGTRGMPKFCKFPDFLYRDVAEWTLYTGPIFQSLCSTCHPDAEQTLPIYKRLPKLQFIIIDFVNAIFGPWSVHLVSIKLLPVVENCCWIEYQIDSFCK